MTDHCNGPARRIIVTHKNGRAELVRISKGKAGPLRAAYNCPVASPWALKRAETLIVEALASGLPLVADKTGHVHLLHASTRTGVSAQAESSCMSQRMHQRLAHALTWLRDSCGVPVSLGLGYCGQGG